jgi:lycopene cyclase domain-containing protein
MDKWTYAFLLLASFSVPIIKSFENRVAFYSRWPELFTGILVMMLIFIPWDIGFTAMGVWSFNYEYVTGIYMLNLPLEEWLFFVIITYCCVFIYEVLRYFFPGFHYPGHALMLTVFLVFVTLALALANTGRIYTFVVMLLTFMLLAWQLVIKSYKTWLSHFYFMYLVGLLPFFLVNGILTALPVVMYDNSRNLGIRIGTVPFEDAFYFMSMMLLTLTVYEYAAARRQQRVHKHGTADPDNP